MNGFALTIERIIHMAFNKIRLVVVLAVACLSLLASVSVAQQIPSGVTWIRPENEKSTPLWGIHGGIVVGLWPASLEGIANGPDGGPRGLLRIGYELNGIVYLINFIAVEPLVNDDMEFSEVRPSVVDGQLGKLFWASGTDTAGSFSPYANTRGIITHPDKLHPEVEELSLFVLMEKFIDGANPYLKVTIRSDNPGELGLQLFNHKNGATMQRCALTATMGNYERLRLLYLKNKVVDSRQLFAGYNDIDFAEKETYPVSEMLKDRSGNPMVIAESSESLSELAAWPQTEAYLKKWHWRYRPFYKLTQYWRLDAGKYDSSLSVRVNGRAKYWGGENADKSTYIDGPGGPAFENFELRENYYSGQKFYFGLSLKPAKELIDGF
jgi:hypothetical protein